MTVHDPRPAHLGVREHDERPGGTFLLGPLTMVFFLVMLAGRFTFDRLGAENPFFVPERLVGFGVLTFLTLVVGYANARAFRPPQRTKVLVAAPVLYFLVTALWGADVPGFGEAVADLVCMLLALAVAAVLLRWDAVVVAETMLWCLAAAGLVFSVAGLTSASTGHQVSAFGGGPNVYSRITVLGFIAVIGLVVLHRLPLAGLASCPLMIVATVVSGSRGGMLAGLIATLMLIPLVRRLKPFQMMMGIGALLACMVLVYRRFQDNVEAIVNGRIVELTIQQGYTSGRGDLFSSAWDLFRDNLFMGSGLRGFEAYYGQGITYPHNLFLLAAAEGGLIGLTILVLVLTGFAIGVMRRLRSPHTLIYTSAASVIFASSMVSGDYYDSRFLWVFMLVALRVPDVHDVRTGASSP